MLTQEDLIAIGNLIDERLDRKFKQEFEPIKVELRELRQDVNQLKRDVNELKTDVHQLKTDVHYLKKETKYIRRDMNMIVRFFDNDIHGIRKRVDRLEDFLHLPPIPS